MRQASSVRGVGTGATGARFACQPLPRGKLSQDTQERTLMQVVWAGAACLLSCCSEGYDGKGKQE